MLSYMDAIQLEEENNVVIEIEIDEMLEEYDKIILRIIYENNLIKEMELNEVVEYENKRWRIKKNRCRWFFS